MLPSCGHRLLFSVSPNSPLLSSSQMLAPCCHAGFCPLEAEARGLGKQLWNETHCVAPGRAAAPCLGLGALLVKWK